MKRFVRILPLVAFVFLLPGPAAVRGQVACPGEHGTRTTACPLGTPGMHGVTMHGTLDYPGQLRAYRFVIDPSIGPMASHIYLGDVWYDMELSVWQDPPNPEDVGLGIELSRVLVVADARSGPARVIQFRQPATIIKSLEASGYTVVVQAADGRSFSANRPYALRVALTPPVCGDPIRDPAGRYQVALTVEPREETITPFSLLSFNAHLSPPYSDLFDFEWTLNGQPIPGNTREVVQLAVPDLPSAPGGQYRIGVTARGVREYPDPDPAFRHIPPTLSADCTFTIR